MKFLPIVIVVALVAAGGAYFFLRGTTKEASVASAPGLERAELQDVLEQSDADRARLQEELDLAQARIELLESEALALADAAGEGEEVPEEAVETPGEKKSGERPTLEQFRLKARETPQVAMQAKAMTDMLYGEFLIDAQLAPEIEAEVRAIMADSLLETIALDQFALKASEDLTWSELAGLKGEEQAFLSEQIRPLLSGEANLSWDAYLEDSDARGLDRALRAEIGMLSGGLTPESMDAAIEVGVAEFLREQYALEESDELYTGTEQVLYRRRAIQSMRELLPEYLAEDQMAELENYLTFADNMLDSQLAQAEQREERRANRLAETQGN